MVESSKSQKNSLADWHAQQFCDFVINIYLKLLEGAADDDVIKNGS